MFARRAVSRTLSSKGVTITDNLFPVGLYSDFPGQHGWPQPRSNSSRASKRVGATAADRYARPSHWSLLQGQAILASFGCSFLGGAAISLCRIAALQLTINFVSWQAPARRSGVGDGVSLQWRLRTLPVSPDYATIENCDQLSLPDCSDAATKTRLRTRAPPVIVAQVVGKSRG